MAKDRIERDNLELAMLAEIRAVRGCEDVQGVSIYHVTDERAADNWSLGPLRIGNSDSGAVVRAAEAAYDKLRQQYTLIPPR